MKFLLALSVAFALTAAPAHAGPLAAAFAWIGSTISGALAAGGATAFFTQMALGIGSSLLASALGALGMKKPEVRVEFEKDIGDDTPLSFVAGFYATAGKSKYIGSWGKNTRFITEVIEISCIPITGVVDIWVNDEKATIDWEAPEIQDDTETLIGYPIKNFSEGVGTSEERDRAWIKVINGNQTTADAFLMAVFGDDEDYPYTSDMIGKGKAYVVATYYYDPEVMTSIPAILVQPEALPVYDVRKDSTNGGSGAHRWGNRSTYEPSDNPAVIAYNIVRGIYYGDEWLFGGKNLPAWRLPSAEWMAAANECDATVTLAGGGTQPAYRCGAEIRVDMVPADVLEEIGRAANMRFAEVGGLLKPIVGLPGTSVLSITDENIIISEGQSYFPFPSLSATYNALSASYPAPGEKWATKDAKEFIDDEATEADGGRYLPTSISYGACPFALQVQRLLRSQMKDYRRFRRHQFHLPPEAYALEPMIDMITWTSERNGYINKKFIVESVAKTPGMLVAVTLREVNPADYDWSVDFESPVTVVTPVNPVPFTQTISGFAVVGVAIKDASNNDRRPALKVSCDGDEVGVTDIQIQVKLSGATNPQLNIKRPFTEPFEWTITELLPNTAYQVRARLISDLTGKWAWSSWLTATTPDIKVGEDDIATEVWDIIDGALADVESEAKSFGITPVSTIPATGTHDGQIILKMPQMVLYRWDAATSSWSTNVYAGVPAGYLDATKFAAGIEPVTIVSTGSLPTTKSTSTIFYGSALYRWNGSAYVKSVPAGDLTGTITSTQIADDAITTPKLAANAVTANEIAANTITAAEIAANTITAGEISAGAIGADQIAANAIVAKHLAIGDFTNMVPDNDLNDLASWSKSGTVGVVIVAGASLDAWGVPKVLSLEAASGSFATAASKPFPVTPGDELFARAMARVAAGSGTAGFQVRTSAAIDMSSPSIRLSLSTGSTTPTEVSGSFDVPTGHVYAQVLAVKNNSGATQVYVGGMEVRRKSGAVLIRDGAITADKISSSAITTDKLAASSIIASKIATGTITAASGIIANAAIGRAQIADAAIGRVQIDDAAITTAKIEDLAVDTLQIKGNAVTVLRKVTHGGATDDSADWEPCGGITFSPSISGDLLVWLSCQVDVSVGTLASGTMSAQLRYLWRGSVVATFTALTVRTDASADPIGPTTIRFADITSFSSGGTSSGTFQLQVRRNGGGTSSSATSSDITYVIGEFKK